MEQRRENVAEVFTAVIDLAERIVAKTESVRVVAEGQLAFRAIMLFFFAKAYKTYQAVRVLWEQGFEQDAFVLGRTIFELALQARYMAEDPLARPKLFEDYDPVVRYRWHKQLKALGDVELTAELDKDPNRLAELKKLHDQCEGRYPKNKGWWGKSIRWLAEHLGREMLKRYATVYWMQSDFVHSGVTSVHAYLKEKGDRLAVVCRPSSPESTMAAQEATMNFLDVMVRVCLGLDLGLNDEIGDAFARFHEAAGLPPIECGKGKQA